jgi:hypothetical protein
VVTVGSRLVVRTMVARWSHDGLYIFITFYRLYTIMERSFELLKKSTEKLHVGHILVAPLVSTARIVTQIPVLLESIIDGRDTSIPTLRGSSMNPRPSDVVFERDDWGSYQCATINLNPEWFNEMLVPNIEYRMDAWSNRWFGRSDTVKYTTFAGSLDQARQWLCGSAPSSILGDRSHIIIVIPKAYTILGMFDHYSCDGGPIFDMFKSIFDLPDVKSPPFPPYQYIPLLTDMVTTEFVCRVGLDSIVRPSLIRDFSPDRLTCTKSTIHKSDQPIDRWNRWGNYSECILRVFERFEGSRSDLGDPAFAGNTPNTGSEPPPVARNKPAYLRICLTAGIDTDCVYGNNRIGCIAVTIDRPTDTLSRLDRLNFIGDQFKSQCTANFCDAMSSYDLMRGFDMRFIRKFASSSIFDITFTSFRFDHDAPMMKSGFGGFIGQVDHPYMYINSITTSDRSLLSYSTNWLF